MTYHLTSESTACPQDKAGEEESDSDMLPQVF